MKQRALGIGGYFLRARNPRALAEWYRDNLGIDTMNPEGEGQPWEQEAGLTVFSTFPADTDYFGSRDQATMLNFRVADLDAMLAQMRGGGAVVDDTIQVMDGIGRFAWVTDPEGNRFEIWEPTGA